jgi:uncharacterized protein
MKLLGRMLLVLAICVGFLLLMFGCAQRRLLYFPSHDNAERAAARLGLNRWMVGDEYTGYARVVSNPRRVWFFLHGNGGQAGDRAYVLPHIDAQDALYILEYPGYGERSGEPARRTIDAAALKAYDWLVSQHGVEKLVVLGESLGSGPASQLAKAPVPPRHIVLVVPFARLQDVAQEKFRFLPVGLLLLDRWDNIEALKDYPGRLDVFGAKYDTVIPVHHARRLAESRAGAVYHEFEGGHGWADGNLVDFRKLWERTP